MSTQPVGTSSTVIDVHLSKDEVSIIWPGLNYIICQLPSREQSGQSITSYPFRVLPLPRGFDSGAFSARMMDQIKDLWGKIQPIKSNGGTLALDEFELRAAIFAARTSVKLERREIRKAPKMGIDAPRAVAGARRGLKKSVARKNRVIDSLEIDLKRANRRFKSLIDPDDLASQLQEWQSHLRWIEFHLTYFKPLPRPATAMGRLKTRRSWLDTLEKMVQKALVNWGYELPDPAELRAVLRRYLDYSLRGRIKDHHDYMTRNSESPVAQRKLLDFVEERLFLKKTSR